MGKIKLYIVEDYFLTRASYKYALSKEKDIEILGDYDNAEECLSAMHAQKADVVLMDLGLPYMNGIEATKTISENFPDTKIIVLTSFDSTDHVLASLYSGASGYMLKDIDIDKMVNIIRAVNMGAMWLDPQIGKALKDCIPKPNSTDFNNLYYKSNIRSILTEREFEVLKLVAQGKSNVEIGKIMMVSTNTAKAHVGSILSKLEVSDRVQTAVLAVRENLF